MRRQTFSTQIAAICRCLDCHRIKTNLLYWMGYIVTLLLATSILAKYASTLFLHMCTVLLVDKCVLKQF